MMSRARLCPTMFGALAAFGVFVSTGAAHAQNVDACISANERAVARERDGKLVEERAELSGCSSSTCPDNIRTSCQRRVQELNERIPTIVFDVKDPTGSDLSPVKISIDGEPNGVSSRGTPIALDPGEHEFRFEATGHPSLVKRYVLREGDRGRAESVVLGEAPSGASPIPQAPIATPPTDPKWRTFAIGAGGLGVAGIAVGTILGLMAKSKWDDARNECPSSTTCNYSTASSDRSAALGLATGSTVSFVVGGAGLAAGAVLLFTAPSGTRAPASGLRLAPEIGPRSAALTLSGDLR